MFENLSTGIIWWHIYLNVINPLMLNRFSHVPLFYRIISISTMCQTESWIFMFFDKIVNFPFIYFFIYFFILYFLNSESLTFMTFAKSQSTNNLNLLNSYFHPLGLLLSHFLNSKHLLLLFYFFIFTWEATATYIFFLPSFKIIIKKFHLTFYVFLSISIEK